jgi:hypothetical protein
MGIMLYATENQIFWGIIKFYFIFFWFDLRDKNDISIIFVCISLFTLL